MYHNNNKFNQVKSFCYINVFLYLHCISCCKCFLAVYCYAFGFSLLYRTYMYLYICIYRFKYHSYNRRPTASLVISISDNVTIGYRWPSPSIVGYRLSVIINQLLVIFYPLSVIHYQLSVAYALAFLSSALSLQ